MTGPGVSGPHARKCRSRLSHCWQAGQREGRQGDPRQRPSLWQAGRAKTDKSLARGAQRPRLLRRLGLVLTTELIRRAQTAHERAGDPGLLVLGLLLEEGVGERGDDVAGREGLGLVSSWGICRAWRGLVMRASRVEENWEQEPSQPL